MPLAERGNQKDEAQVFNCTMGKLAAELRSFRIYDECVCCKSSLLKIALKGGEDEMLSGLES
jgi:hypothetical protein